MTEFREGLRSADLDALTAQYGKNILGKRKRKGALARLIRVFSEPMFLLLLGAAALYFFLGEPVDGAILSVFVVAMILIDYIQERRTDRTLEALDSLASPRVLVRRDGEPKEIDGVDLLPGDVAELKEGDLVPADGILLRAESFCVNESSLSGESSGVWKQARAPDSEESNTRVYAGTSVLHGNAVMGVTAIGNATELGKIGGLIRTERARRTPLQRQTRRLVAVCAIVAGVLFLLVALATYLHSSELGAKERMTQSILAGVALAMAMLPEEFPVVLTVFLSMGAWRLAKKHALVKSLPAAETLGAVSVLCADKTGTLTENKMKVADRFAQDPALLARVLYLACEHVTLDASELAIREDCAAEGCNLEYEKPLKTYPFTPEAMTMGILYETDEGLLLAAKGAPERLLSLCHMPAAERTEIMRQSEAMANEGLRIYAAAYARPLDAPEALANCPLTFAGLVGLSDPPRPGIAADVKLCRQAGVRIVMITGDGASTARAIARRVGLPCARIMSGGELAELNNAELLRRVGKTDLFYRVVPEQKLRIVRALQELGETVAMTGDGVNDAPALKAADIGIAMGRQGSEIARQAADLILLDDNFATIPTTILDARRMYANIRRAVGYIFAIHIPIALVALLAPLCGFADMPLKPVHMVLLELLIDPTCSVVLERIPATTALLRAPPRGRAARLIDPRSLAGWILQGLTLFGAAFGAYCFVLPAFEMIAARTALLIILLWGSFWLVVVNASPDSPITGFKNMFRDKLLRVLLPVTLVLPVLAVYTPIAYALGLCPLSAGLFFACFALSAASVGWYEIVKAVRRSRMQKTAGSETI